MEENNKMKPGRAMGWIAFVNVILNSTATYLIIIFQPGVDIQSLIKISSVSLSVFMIVFGAVFGSGMMKKWVNKDNNHD